MSFGMSAQKQTEKGETQPWDKQQPYLLKGWDEAAKQLGEGGAQYFPGSTVTPYSDQSLAGMGLMEGIAAGTKLPYEASQQAGDTVNGRYLASPEQWASRTANPYASQGSNGYIDNVATAVRRQVTPGVQSAYGASGRSGESPLAQAAIARGVSDSLAPYMFNSAEADMNRKYQSGENAANRGAELYTGERSRQLAAASMAPELDKARYAPAEALMKVGAADEAKQSEYLRQAMARWDMEQNAPRQALDDYTNIIQGTNWGSQFNGTKTGKEGGVKANPFG